MPETRIPGLRRVLRLRARRALRSEIEDEIRFHLDARIAELVADGLPEPEARRQAMLEFGDLGASLRELLAIDHRRHGHEEREELLMSFAQDMRYAARGLARRPALLVVTTAVLCIGIAANAVTFGVVDQLLLRPPAHVVAPESVKRIYFRDVGRGEVNISDVTTYPVVTALRNNTAAFSDVAAMSFKSSYSLGHGVDATSVVVQLVSGGYFRLLGVRPALGRFFVDEDDRIPGGQPVAVLSHGAWQQRFAGDSSVIGRVIPMQGKSWTVVGVAPRRFSGIDREKIDIWLPIAAAGDDDMGAGWHNTANNWWARVIARVRPEASPEAATAQATATYRGLVREWGHAWRDTTSSIVLASIIGTRGPDGLTFESKVSLWLMGVSLLVLLIACANVANLLVARTIERRREISVRLALGVSRARLVRMLLGEAALLALVAAAAALAVAYSGSRVVQRILLPEIVWDESVLDARVFAFTLGVAVVCVVLAGLAPAFQGMRTRVSEGLKASARQVAGGRGQLRFALLLTQAALSVILLVGAGLFVFSLRKVVSRDVGIDRDRVLRVTMPLSRFGFDRAQREDIFRRGAERLRVIPGVSGVAVARLCTPLGGASASGFTVSGLDKQPELALGGPYNSAVTADFFATVGARILRGRGFTAAEERSGARVLVVNETLAKAYWPEASPIGRCATFGGDSVCSEIIGVVQDVMQFSLIRDDRAMVYAPELHPGARDAPPGAMLVRVSGDPATVVPMVRRELQALAPDMPFVAVRMISELVAPQLQPWRLAATMFTLFGLLALAIAAIGLYSVLAYWVTQRTHEIGVRMALGAQRGQITRMVGLQTARGMLLGIAIGFGTALLASRWIEDMLYETSPRDPAVYILAAAVLLLAALLASIVPVRRSTAVDPAIALRAD